MPGQHSVKLFLSYSHKDEPFRDVLATHLKILERQKVIDVWHDHMIGAGAEFEDDIDVNLKTADIILLLVSADFMASDYCVNKEVPRAMQKHEDKTATVIPISLRPCDTKNMAFMKLQGLPKNFKPISKWECQDEAYADIVKGIRTIAEKIRNQRSLNQPKTLLDTALSSQKVRSRENRTSEDLSTQQAVLESHMDSLLGFYKKNKDIAHSLQEFTKELLSLNSLSAILEHVLENAKSFFNLDVISLCLVDEKGEIAQFLKDDGFDLEANQGLILLTSNELIKSTFSSSAYPYIGSYKASKYGSFFSRFKHKPVSIAVTLLNRKEKYLGALNLGSYDPDRFTGTMASDLVERMASTITVCLENHLNFEAIQRMIFVDTLTGVNNRRFFEQRIDEELDRCKRNNEPVSCLFLDIDFFKKVNDTYGHQGGDLVLSTVATAIKTQMRSNDVLARFGGDGFLVLLPKINESMALNIAECIRNTVQALNVGLDKTTLTVTISIGSATYTPGIAKLINEDVASRLIKLSDSACYKAKRNGRNRVESGGNIS